MAHRRTSIPAWVLAGALLMPSPGHAQVLIGLLFGDRLSSETFHIGLTVGPNLANLTGIEGTSVQPGLALGLLGEWRITDHLYLQPEILPFYRVGANDMPLEELKPPIDSLATDRHAERNLSYFEVPVILKYGVAENRFMIGVGPQFGFLLDASDKGQAVINNEITVKANLKDDLNSTDAGVVFNAEYKLQPGPFATSVGARYYLGLTDLVKDNPGDGIYNRVFTVFVSVAMGGSAEDEGSDAGD